MERGICKLSLFEKDLQDSHFLGKAVYKVLSGLNADFHRKILAPDSNRDSRADNSGFASARCARQNSSRQTFAANGKILPGEWQYRTECMRERIENPAFALRGIGRLREY